jgi:hypothetical protein
MHSGASRVLDYCNSPKYCGLGNKTRSALHEVRLNSYRSENAKRRIGIERQTDQQGSRVMLYARVSSKEQWRRATA